MTKYTHLKKILTVGTLLTLVIAATYVIFLVTQILTEPVIDFLNVGQGDATLIRQGWQEALIDGGPDRSVMSQLGQSMPYLDRRIEYVIATHPHDDHVKGLIPVLERYQVGRLIIPTALAKEPAYQPLLAQAEKQHTPVVQAAAGDHLDLNGTALTVLWPPADCLQRLDARNFDVKQHDPQNICSLVLRLDYCDQHQCRRALFMADATSESESIMAEQKLIPQADLLKVGHHGSRYASTVAFIKAVHPKNAVIEVGKNHFGHPNLGVLLRLQAIGAKIWRTDQNGTIRAIPNKTGFELFSR